MKTFVHIGFLKTGSTAAQRDFARKREALRRRGILYPGGTRKHGALEAVAIEAASGRPASPEARRKWQAATDQIASFEGDSVLLSAETICRMRVAALRELRRIVRDAATDPIAIVYVRNPVASAVSLAQEDMKRRALTLDDVSQRPTIYDLPERLKTFADVFGQDALIVRPFDRSQLVDGMTQADILHTMGYRGETGFLPARQLNESLSMPAAIVLDAIMAQRGRSSEVPSDSKAQETLENRFKAVPGPKFALPQATLDRVRRDSQSALAWLEAEHGIILPEPEMTAREDIEELFPDATVEDLRTALDELQIDLDLDAVIRSARKEMSLVA